MAEFRTAIDIANRACDHVGCAVIDETLGFAENSDQAALFERQYGKLRQAELRRNVWRFAIRTAILRAIDTDTMLLSPALWVSSSTYFRGSIVSDAAGRLWISNIPDNLGFEPESTVCWDQYFGPMTVSLYATGGSYYAGELVYTTAGAGTSRVYLSLLSGNEDNPATATAWSATKTYEKNQVVTYLSVAYMSLIDLNLNQTPLSSPAAWATVFVGGAGSLQWLQIGGAEFPNGVTLETLNIIYPLGAGPWSQSSSRNVFRLPASFLRKAPADPKMGSNSYLGSPTNAGYSDWNFQGDYITSAQVDPLFLRFVADTVDVSRMDAMFCEGLAARMGLEGCERITQSADKKQAIASEYSKFMSEARLVNAIETGSEEPPLDDFIACRA